MLDHEGCCRHDYGTITANQIFCSSSYKYVFQSEVLAKWGIFFLPMVGYENIFPCLVFSFPVRLRHFLVGVSWWPWAFYVNIIQSDFWSTSVVKGIVCWKK